MIFSAEGGGGKGEDVILMNDCWLSGKRLFSSWDSSPFWLAVCAVFVLSFFVSLTCAHTCYVMGRELIARQCSNDQLSLSQAASIHFGSLYICVCLINISRVRKEILGTPKKCNTVCTEKVSHTAVLWVPVFPWRLNNDTLSHFNLNWPLGSPPTEPYVATGTRLYIVTSIHGVLDLCFLIIIDFDLKSSHRLRVLKVNSNTHVQVASC